MSSNKPPTQYVVTVPAVVKLKDVLDPTQKKQQSKKGTMTHGK